MEIEMNRKHRQIIASEMVLVARDLMAADRVALLPGSPKELARQQKEYKKQFEAFKKAVMKRREENYKQGVPYGEKMVAAEKELKAKRRELDKKGAQLKKDVDNAQKAWKKAHFDHGRAMDALAVEYRKADSIVNKARRELEKAKADLYREMQADIVEMVRANEFVGDDNVIEFFRSVNFPMTWAK
jgi:hypothetical protein